MTLKTYSLPGSGMTVKMGRRRPVAVGPHLSIGNYMLRSLPTPPPTVDWSPAAKTSLADIYCNDQLGCCVASAGYHQYGVVTGNAGNEFHATSQQIIKDYSAIGGYVPGRPNTDQGCDEVTALNYWTQHGFANGSKLAGWLAVDATDQVQVMTALYLFENVLFGVELPDYWVNQGMPRGDGFTWDLAGNPDPQNGHAFLGVGGDSRGVLIDTWGMLGHVTWKAVAAYASRQGGGELYTLLSPDMIVKASQKAPNGFDWGQLVADADSLGGNIPIPTPTPIPPIPTPTPTPPVPTPTPIPQGGPSMQQVTQVVNAALVSYARSLRPMFGSAVASSQPYVDAAIKKVFSQHP